MTVAGKCKRGCAAGSRDGLRITSSRHHESVPQMTDNEMNQSIHSSFHDHEECRREPEMQKITKKKRQKNTKSSATRAGSNPCTPGHLRKLYHRYPSQRAMFIWLLGTTPLGHAQVGFSLQELLGRLNRALICLGLTSGLALAPWTDTLGECMEGVEELNFRRVWTFGHSSNFIRCHSGAEWQVGVGEKQSRSCTPT